MSSAPAVLAVDAVLAQQRREPRQRAVEEQRLRAHVDGDLPREPVAPQRDRRRRAGSPRRGARPTAARSARRRSPAAPRPRAPRCQPVPDRVLESGSVNAAADRAAGADRHRVPAGHRPHPVREVALDQRRRRARSPSAIPSPATIVPRNSGMTPSINRIRMPAASRQPEQGDAGLGADPARQRRPDRRADGHADHRRTW